MNIDSTQIVNLWNAYQLRHKDMQSRWNHYKGKIQFLSKKHNSDGSEKSNVGINFLDYIIEQHVAGSTSIPFQYVQKDDSDKTPIENLQSIYEENDLETLDTEHFKTALVCGYSVECLSVKDGKIQCKQYSPMEWSMLMDAEGEIYLAIHKTIVQPNMIHQGTFFDEKTTLYTVYDESTVRIYKETITGLSQIYEGLHFFGKPPVVIFKVNNEGTPFLTDNLIQANSLYCKLVNNRVDDIDYNVDSLLKITGYGGADMSNPQDLAKIRAMKDAKVFVIPDQHSDIDFIQKGNETQKYKEAIDNARETIFIQGKVPDRRDVQGAIGNLSGVAIKHMYQPTMQQSAFFLKYFKKSLRQRIALINAIWGIQGYPLLVGYFINSNFYLPVDVESIVNAATKLEGIVSKTKILEMLPDVDPETEMKRLESESKIQPLPVPANPEERAKELEAKVFPRVKKTSQTLQDDFLKGLQKDVADRVVQSKEFQDLFQG